MNRSMLILAPLAILAVCLVLAAGCLQEQGAEKEPTPTMTPSPVFGPEHNGKNVSVPAGTRFSLRLPENPTTGYMWNMTRPHGLAIDKDEFIAPDTKLVGAGGTREWVFSSLEKGSTLVHAEYRRPWVPAGTIVFVPLEGGFFGIAGDDGKNYLPLSLSPEFKVDGLRVAFEAEEAPDTATIQMWGTPVNVTFIETVEVFDLHVSVT
ncbi:MAG: protease inhibitor I42 family protein [Methanolinea sp.]|nr:protease inhibitor I42 family protein [Methanolinea sp.]